MVEVDAEIALLGTGFVWHAGVRPPNGALAGTQSLGFGRWGSLFRQEEIGVLHLVLHRGQLSADIASGVTVIGSSDIFWT